MSDDLDIKYAAILAEIESMVVGEIDAGRTVVATWVTQAIVSAHASITGDDVPWHRCLAYRGVRSGVREVLRRYRNDEPDVDPQILLPGFNRLQVAYLVPRKEGQVLVPIDQLTEGEVGAKLSELERMAAGCTEHARELRRYVAARSVG